MKPSFFHSDTYLPLLTLIWLIGLAVASVSVHSAGYKSGYKVGAEDQKNGKIVWTTNVVQNVTFNKIEKK